jgi:hypothetical protein
MISPNILSADCGAERERERTAREFQEKSKPIALLCAERLADLQALCVVIRENARRAFAGLSWS